MKYLLLIIIILLLFNKSNEEFNLLLRIENAVKYMLSNLENIDRYNKAFTLKYPKYKINFNNFRIISPILDNITMYEQDVDSPLFTFDNITFGFFFDIQLFYNHERNLYIKDNYLNTTVSLRFRYSKNEEYLYFDSFGDIDTNIDLIQTHFDIYILDYFKEFKERKKCLCKNSEEKYQYKDPNIFIYNILQDNIKYYVSKYENLNIIMGYDACMIFNKTLTTIKCSDDTINKYNISYIKINKILFPYTKFGPKYNFKSKVWINQLIIMGIYFSPIYNREKDFRFELDEYMNPIISLLNGRITFSFDKPNIYCNDCNEEKNALEYIIRNDYKTYLFKANENYYNDNN